MVNNERQNKRPACGWPVPKANDQGKPDGTRECGSEERVYGVSGRGLYTGRKRESVICEKHLPDAIKKWNWDTAEPLCPSRT